MQKSEIYLALLAVKAMLRCSTYYSRRCQGCKVERSCSGSGEALRSEKVAVTEGCKFHPRSQGNGESVSEFVMALKMLTALWDIG